MTGLDEGAAIALAVLAMLLLTALERRRRAMPLAVRIDSRLPQTQCTQCGYAGCRPYADAIASGDAPINRCPPGGDRVIAALARITGRPRLALDTSCGSHKPRQLASIDEDRCIGCTLCIQACPVDAIVGAPKLMHTVIAAQCTGCELCLPPCPVDCIELRPAPWPLTDIVLGRRAQAARESRTRYDARNARLDRGQRQQVEQVEPLATGAAAEHPHPELDRDAAAARKRAIVAAALERARAKLATGAAYQGRA